MKDIISQLFTNDSVNWILPVTWLNLVFALASAIICGAIIYYLYHYFYRGSFYNHNFNLLLVLVTIITALVITTVSSNLALSLGMVGALSIVRFRTAIKDPLDVGFIFYAIAAGITAGAGLYAVALVGTIVIALVYLSFNHSKPLHPNYLLVVKYANQADKAVQKALAQEKTTLKNRTYLAGEIELTLAVNAQTTLHHCLEKIKNVSSVILVEFNGDYFG
jgi:uncharacterized membrane protein YhiD involved in acid resistance